tara:strand:- start:1508 stop:1798 length:291 start_codon:yes stop_codon:yes gene_type:complete
VLEKTITNAILKWLKTQPDVFAWKTIGSQFTMNGIPDICGNVGTRALYLEVKTATGKVSLRQQSCHNHISRAGGLALVVRSLEEAQDAVETLRKLP